MNNIQKRFILFLVGCIGTRLLLVLIAKNININYLPYMGYLAILIAFGFIYWFITGKRQIGIEVFGDKIWWNNLRPIHALLYLFFAYYALNKNRKAWVFLLVDVIIGLFSFTIYHYKEGNFQKII